MSALCPCSAPVDGAFLCPTCTDDLARLLSDLGAVADALDVAYLRQQRFSVAGRGNTNPDESPMPYQGKAGRLRRELSRELLRLVLIAAPERLGYHPSYDPALTVDTGTPTLGGYPTTPALAQVVIDRLDRVRCDVRVVDVVKRLHGIHRKALRTVDRPPDLVYLGTCDALSVVDHLPGGFQKSIVRCPADLYAEWGETFAICGTCKHPHPVAERRDALIEQLSDQLATATDISRGLSGLEIAVTAERIRQWKARKRIVDRGPDLRGNPRYRVGDVIDLALAENQRRRKDPA